VGEIQPGRAGEGDGWRRERAFCEVVKK